MADVGAGAFHRVEHVGQVVFAATASHVEFLAVVGGFDHARQRTDLGHRRIRQIERFDGDALARVDHVLELVGGSERQVPAVVHDEDAVADLLDLLHVVAGVDHRGAGLVEPLDAFQNRIAALRVDGDRGFVEEDQVRLVRDAAGDVQASQQTAGQFAGPELPEVLETDEFDGLLDQRRTVSFLRHVQRAEVVDVFGDGQFIEHGHVLRHDADTALQRVGGRRHRLAEHANRARIVGEQREDAVDRGGFAGPVRSKQAENLALVHVKVKVVERHHVAVAFDQLADVHGQGRVGCRVVFGSSVVGCHSHSLPW